MEKLHQKINSLKSVFKRNVYLKNFMKLCIKKNLDKLFVKNKLSLTVPKLLFLDTSKSSLDFRGRLKRSIEKKKFCKLNVVFRSSCKIRKFFRFKESL